VKPLLLAFACLLSFPAFAQTEAKAVDTPSRQIEGVIEAFRTSIIDKDKARFVNLLLHDDITWQSVVSDANLPGLREKKPDAVKVRFDPTNSPLSFIDGIVSSKKRLEEKFWNTKIETDGDVASVLFDYSFNVDGKETNHGKEAWHLVKTDDGWKIVSVIWSLNWDPKSKS
jgi:hypothetical protein